VSFLALAGSALTLGFVHGLGADHLMAIAVLSVDRQGRRATPGAILGTAVRFASGHALLLGVGASLAVLFGWVVPAAIESGAETLGGVLLIVLGAAGIWHLAAGRAYSHIHADRQGRARWHFHLGGRHADDTHPSRLATLMGAVFAVSSLRMLMLLAPFGEAAGALALPALLAVIVLFGLGVLLSMSLFGVLLARVFSLRVVDRLGRAAAALVALASVALGVVWIA
jgi:nickel/cobalt exporter